MIKKSIVKAYNYAKKCHKGQKRKFSKLPYFTHPVAVARIVEDMGGTEDMICAALLHDVVEDCDVEHIDILTKFGREVSGLVVELTNDPVEQLKWQSKGQYLGRKIQNMSEEATTIKLADRLHNVMYLGKDEMPFSFVKKYYHETREILSELRGGFVLNEHTVLYEMIHAHLNYLLVKDERLL